MPPALHRARPLDPDVPLDLVELIHGKKVVIGAIGEATETVERPEMVAGVLRSSRESVYANKPTASTHCGMAPIARSAAADEVGARFAGAAIFRDELADVDGR